MGCNLFVTFAPPNKDKEFINIMKTKQFVRSLKATGCRLVRHGGGHDKWFSPITGKSRFVPRHGSNEVPPGLLKSLKKDLLGL